MHKFVTMLPLSFWMAILLVIGAWAALGVGGIGVVGVLLLLMN